MRQSPYGGVLGRFLACVTAGALATQSLLPVAHAQAPSAPSSEAAPKPGEAAAPAEAAKPAEPPKPAKPPTKKEKDAARKAFGDGEKAYQAGDFAAAYENFKKADEIIPSSQAVYWQAKSLEGQGKLEEAAATYESFLANPGTATPDKIDDAKQRLDEIKAKLVGEVSIETTPEVAQVSVDGTPQPGETPMTLKLPPGKHKLSFTAMGYEPKELEIEVKVGESQKQAVALTPVPKEEPVAAPPPPPPAPAPPPPAPVAEKRSMVPAYVTLGIAAVGAGVGTYFGIKALNAKSDFDDNPTADAADDAERNALFADMLFGVAITLGVTGVVLLTSGDEAPAPAAKAKPLKRPAVVAAPYVSPKGGGAAARVSF